jgi:ATP-binding cassette subfamily B multidrug efflux pump
MAVQREEEKLGAFTLFRHFLRIMAYVRGQRSLLALCVVLSVAEAGVELALPLLTRAGIDRYILPPYTRISVRSDEGRRIAEAAGAVPGGTTEDFAFLRLSALSRADQEEVRARGLADSRRYYLVPAGAKGGWRFVDETSLAALPATERRAIVAQERAGVARLAILYLALLALNFLLSYGSTYGLNVLGEKAVVILRSHVYRHLHRLPVRYFDENPVGRIVTRVTNDTATLSELFTSVIATAVSDVALFGGILAVLLVLDGQLTWRLFLLAPPLVALALWFKWASQKVYRVIRVQLARLNTFLQEAVQGVIVLKAFSAQGRSSERFASLGEEYFRTQMRLIYIFAVFRPLIDAFATSAVALVIWFGGGQVLRGSMTIGTLVAFLAYLRMLFMPLQDLAEKFNILQSSVVASERIFKLLDTPAEEPGEGRVPEAPCGEIRFEDVSFSYEEGQPVLRGVSFEIPCGKTVALVGPTGSGKTTLTSLLLRFYDLKPGNGRILVDGIPVHEWDLRALRSQFAFVPQELFLFAGSLERNITLFREIAPEGLVQALRVSRAEAVIARLPLGLSHPLNERGTIISQGERQLISFARALAAGPRILVLDEATASVDSRTEMLIQQALRGLLQDRTALVVAHRLSTVQDAHTIVVLSKGRVVEQGSHEELLARGGLYAHLYRTQFATA